MRYKISFYIFLLKSKFITSTLFLLLMFSQIINLIEVSRVLGSQKFDMSSIFYLSLLKLPSTMLQIIPFVIIISTAFFYRYLINNNELISMRNVGYSIIDIFKPVALSIILFGSIFLFIVNPIAAFSENKFEGITSKNDASFYSIKIKNNEIWIKNNQEDKINYIKFSYFDLRNMKAENIKIIEINKNNKKFYIADTAYLDGNNLKLQNLSFFNISTEENSKIDSFWLNVNFNKNDIINSISNYKNIPFYKYNQHINSLKKFNLYSPEVSLFYLSELFKPIFLLILGFVVMGFSSKFKKNTSFFKILFISILIGFIFFIFNEILEGLAAAKYMPFWLSYFILIVVSSIIGIYQSINIETSS